MKMKKKVLMKPVCSETWKSNFLFQPPVDKNISINGMVKLEVDSESAEDCNVSQKLSTFDCHTITRKIGAMSKLDGFDLCESSLSIKFGKNETNASSHQRDDILKEQLLNGSNVGIVHKNTFTYFKDRAYSTSVKRKSSDLNIKEAKGFASHMKIVNIQRSCGNIPNCVKGSIWLQSLNWSKDSNLMDHTYLSEGGNYCKKDYQLGGLAEKTLKLMRFEKSAVVLWQHESYLRSNKGSQKCCNFIIDSHFSFHHFVAMRCQVFEISITTDKDCLFLKTISSNKNREVYFNSLVPDILSGHIKTDSIDSGAVLNEKPENVIECYIVVKLKVFQDLKLKPGNYIKICPPWLSLGIKGIDIPVLLCTHFIEVLHKK